MAQCGRAPRRRLPGHSDDGGIGRVCLHGDLRQGLDEKLGRARAFYGILALSMLFGMALTFTSIKPMDALFYSAVINGLLAPFVLVGILLVVCDHVLMRNQSSSLLAKIAVGITPAGMFAAGIANFWF